MPSRIVTPLLYRFLDDYISLDLPSSSRPITHGVFADEQRCKCYFFDAGTEKTLKPHFKTLIARLDRDRRSLFVGLTFPPDFPFYQSVKATTQRISNFISGAQPIHDSVSRHAMSKHPTDIYHNSQQEAQFEAA